MSKTLGRNFEIINRNFEILSQHLEILSGNFEIICRNLSRKTLTETDSILSKISSKTAHGKKDST